MTIRFQDSRFATLTKPKDSRRVGFASRPTRASGRWHWQERIDDLDALVQLAMHQVFSVNDSGTQLLCCGDYGGVPVRNLKASFDVHSRFKKFDRDWSDWPSLQEGQDSPKVFLGNRRRQFARGIDVKFLEHLGRNAKSNSKNCVPRCLGFSGLLWLSGRRVEQDVSVDESVDHCTSSREWVALQPRPCRLRALALAPCALWHRVLHHRNSALDARHFSINEPPERPPWCGAPPLRASRLPMFRRRERWIPSSCGLNTPFCAALSNDDPTQA